MVVCLIGGLYLLKVWEGDFMVVMLIEEVFVIVFGLMFMSDVVILLKLLDFWFFVVFEGEI